MSSSPPPLTSSSTSSTISNDNKLDGVLPLAYKVLTRDADKQDALRLVADSIAQQRQIASAAIIFHPLCLTAFAAACSIAYRHYQHEGYGSLLTMLSGVTIIYLATVRFYTSRYIQLAEAFCWKSWLAGPNNKDDTVIAAVFGEETIGTVVLRLKPSGNEAGRGVIRAWTTKLRYRGKGVGLDLLQFAVQATREAFGPGAAAEFAPDHANSVNPLADMFNSPFEKRQGRAVRALARAAEEAE